ARERCPASFQRGPPAADRPSCRADLSHLASKPCPSKALPEKLPCPVKAGFDRFHWHIEDRRDPVIRHALVIVEDEDRAVLVLEPVHGRVNLLLFLFGQESLLQVDAAIRKVG